LLTSHGAGCRGWADRTPMAGSAPPTHRSWADCLPVPVVHTAPLAPPLWSDAPHDLARQVAHHLAQGVPALVLAPARDGAVGWGGRRGSRRVGSGGAGQRGIRGLDRTRAWGGCAASPVGTTHRGAH